MKTRSFLLILITCILSACSIMPFPHFSNLTPKVNGKILNNSHAVVETKIRIIVENEKYSCDGKYKETITDASGKYSFEPIRKFNPIIVVMAHGFFKWNICINQKDQWSKIASVEDYSLVDSGPSFDYEINCELSNKTEEICDIKRILGSE